MEEAGKRQLVAYSLPQELHQGVLDQGVQFIHKPFAVDDLAAKVREVLDSK